MPFAVAPPRVDGGKTARRVWVTARHRELAELDMLHALSRSQRAELRQIRAELAAMLAADRASLLARKQPGGQ